jgi:hypothetical protein
VTHVSAKTQQGISRPYGLAYHEQVREGFFFLEAFCDISHRLGGITPFGVFSDAFPGLKMWKDREG